MKLAGWKELGLIGLIVVLCLATQAKNHHFLSGGNIENMARLAGIYGIFSIGSGLVIMTSGIDLSVGSMFALLGVLMSIELTNKHWNPILVVFTTLAIGSLLGLFHAYLITKVRLQPFLVTLCALLFYRGIARFLANDNSMGFGESKGFEGLRNFCSGSYFGVPVPFLILVVVAVVMAVVVHCSVYGRHLLAAGRNEDAARFSGINTRYVIGSAYVIGGFLAGITAILLAFYTNSILPSSHGNFFELYGIAAAVLGGCSLRGGEGSVLGIILGTILLQVLNKLNIFFDVPSSLEYAVTGAVILLGVLADQWLARRSALRART